MLRMAAFVVRSAVSLCALVLSVNSALAGKQKVPDPATSTTDGDLMLGNARGNALFQPGGLPLTNVVATINDGYRVVVRDVGGTPLDGVTVTMNFGTGVSATGIQPYSIQSSGQVGDCTNHALSKVTAGGGEVIFFPATVGANVSASPNVQIRANGVLLTTIRYRSIDLVCSSTPGLGCVEQNDANFFRQRFVCPEFPNCAPEHDEPSCDFATLGPSAGVVDNSDANVFRTEFLCGFPTQAQCATGPSVICSRTACTVCP